MFRETETFNYSFCTKLTCRVIFRLLSQFVGYQLADPMALLVGK